MEDTVRPSAKGPSEPQVESDGGDCEEVDQRLGDLMTLAESKSAALEAALRAVGVDPIPTRPATAHGDTTVQDRGSEHDPSPEVPPQDVTMEIPRPREPLEDGHDGMNTECPLLSAGGKWSEFDKLQSASELRKLEEAEEDPSGVDVSSIAPHGKDDAPSFSPPHDADDHSPLSSPQEDDFTPSQLDAADEERHSSHGHDSLCNRFQKPRAGGASADTWFASGVNANRHLSLRTHRVGLLPRPSGGPQTSRAAIELNTLNASVAEFPRMPIPEDPPPPSSKLPSGSKFKFGYEPSVSTDVAPGLESYLKEIGSSFTARSRTGQREAVENESPSRVRERLLFEMMKVYDDAAPGDGPSSLEGSVVN
ncbi:hypothetical protein FOL46_007042 [Perkinsus olseni]|uniref:Uncharacterized protein n=1 Tax=Perkinsus olseni TaxID=32597 RepID=A0A7J6LGJ7_PEROL|nr:hypothetical protein FOL46_007042 [Perkinsus olseni]